MKRITLTLPAPYFGLRPFTEDESLLFFGRESHVRDLLASLERQQRFTAVLGASGTGKSALVRAGLIPALHRGALHPRGCSEVTPPVAWNVCIFQPGDAPLANLGRALIEDPRWADNADRAAAVSSLAAVLGTSPLALSDLYPPEGGAFRRRIAAAGGGPVRGDFPLPPEEPRRSGQPDHSAAALGQGSAADLHRDHHALGLSRPLCCLPRLAGGDQQRPLPDATPRPGADQVGNRVAARPGRRQHRPRTRQPHGQRTRRRRRTADSRTRAVAHVAARARAGTPRDRHRRVRDDLRSAPITTVAAYHGYHTAGGALEVGQSSTQGGVYSSILILIFDYILTQLILT